MKRILVVDDNSVNLYLMQSLLGSHGYVVSTAANGAEALQSAQTERPDLIIADILMPVMDGFELCRAWMADPQLQHVPFVFYTATYTDEKDERFALDLGATRFIVKPQEPDALLRAIEDVLASQAAEKGVPQNASLLDDTVYYQQYNQALIRKLEDKMSELEQDIAERKRVEADLKRLTTAIEHASEVVMVTDPNGAIQYVNPAFEAMTGYTRLEALGQNPRLLKSGKQDSSFYEELWQTISSGKTWTGRMINKRKDGRLYTEDSTISPVTDASGTIINYVAIHRDVTDYLLLTQQLQQAMKMEAVGRLAGGIAHDFNNALTPLLGIISLLLQRMHPADPFYSDIKEMVDSIERCTKLIRQLLAFSRSQQSEVTTFNLNDVVANMVRMLSRLIGEDIELITQLTSDPCMIHADAGQMEQIIANLAVNARDAMPQGGRLTIETSHVHLDLRSARHVSVPQAGTYVALTMHDTGVGMDAETMARVFEPFFTTKDKGKGTGLGLSTVYGIVTQNKGGITVSSEPGQGTTFTVYLPQAECVTEPTEHLTETRVSPLSGNETILLAEDDDSVRAVAARMLTNYGYNVLQASNGSQAVQICDEYPEPIHLLIADIVMPGMNGKEIARHVTALRPAIAVLFMSGYLDDSVLPQGIVQTISGYLQKPFTSESLCSKVRSVLDHR